MLALCRALFYRIALVSSVLSVASAAPVTLVNPGFESPVLADGSFSTTIPGWIISNPFDPGTVAAGVFNPTAVSTTGGAAAEGTNAAFLSNGRRAPGGLLLGQMTHISQMVGAFDPAASYSLSVAVGRRVDVPYADYFVSLLVGGNRIAFTQSLLGIPSPPVGGYSNVTVNSGPRPDLMMLAGSPLEVRLGTIVLEFDANTSQTLFDAVALNEETVPEPSAVLLIGSGLALLGALRRGRS